MQKVVCPYEYMDDWGKFNEISLPEKEDFYIHLNMEDITDADYTHTKRVCKNFEIKGLGEYQDLHVESNKLLLSDCNGTRSHNHLVRKRTPNHLVNQFG